MLAQIVQQLAPFIPGCFIQRPPTRAVAGEPNLFAPEQRTHARDRKPEVAQGLAVTRMDHVDRFRSFGNDRGAEFAVRRRSDWRNRASFLRHSSSLSGQRSSVSNVSSSFTVKTRMMFLKSLRNSATR